MPTPFFLVFLGGVGAYFAQAERLPLVAVAAVAARHGSARQHHPRRRSARGSAWSDRRDHVVRRGHLPADASRSLNAAAATSPVMELTLTGALTGARPVHRARARAPAKGSSWLTCVPLTARRGPSPVVASWERQQRLIGAPRG